MATQELFVNGATIEFLNGDSTYAVTVFYRDRAGNVAGSPDKFSFSTATKLKKFISHTLLDSDMDVAPAAAETDEAVGNV